MELEAIDDEAAANAAYIAAANPTTVLRLLDDRDRLMAEIARLRAKVDEFGKVMTNIVPGEHGEGEEVPATPASIRSMIAELQSEWDNAEKRIARLRAEAEWRPISTCPDEYTDKMFFYPESNVKGRISLPNMVRVCRSPKETPRQPTHWRPIPQPPEAQ